MKLLLVNTDPKQLKFDAGNLKKFGFDILIANNFDYLKKIILDKKPEIIFLTINQVDHDASNLFLSRLVSLHRLMIIKAPKEFQRITLFHEQFQLIQLEAETTLLENIVEICIDYKEKNSSSEEVLSQTKITKSNYSSIVVNRANKLAFSEESSYDYGRIFSLLKNDKVKILGSLNEFLVILNRSLTLTEEAIKTSEFEPLRVVFHDLLNLAEYYGATLLFELVLEYKGESIFEKKAKLLLQINEEQKNVYNYYILVEQNLNSSK